MDAEDADALAAFWQAALGYRLLYTRPPYRVLGPEPDSGPAGAPRLLVQQVPAHRGPSGRVHLDLRVPDPQAVVARLVGLGGVVLSERDERSRGGSRWWVLADPEGTVFCVCPARSGSPA